MNLELKKFDMRKVKFTADSKANGGSGIRALLVNASFGSQNYGYDLCGISDGSGRFMLAASYDLRNDMSSLGAHIQAELTQGNSYGGYCRFYVSTGTGSFKRKKQLAVANILQSGKPYLACNNDSIWLLMAGSLSDVKAGWERLDGKTSSFWSPATHKYCNTYNAINYGGTVGGRFMGRSRENSMYHLRIDSDLNIDKWKYLGDESTEVIIGIDGLFNPNLRTGKTTGGLGAYFFIPSSGSLYSCGPYMAFCSVGVPRWMGKLTENEGAVDYGSFKHSAQYYRFSGWMIRPPYINLGMNSIYEDSLDIVKAFVHQETGILSTPEFNYVWGAPAGTGTNGNYVMEDTLWSFMRLGGVFPNFREDGILIQEMGVYSTTYQSCFYYFRCPTVADVTTWSSGSGQAYQTVLDSDVRYPMFPLTMQVTDNYST